MTKIEKPIPDEQNFKWQSLRHQYYATLTGKFIQLHYLACPENIKRLRLTKPTPTQKATIVVLLIPTVVGKFVD